MKTQILGLLVAILVCNHNISAQSGSSIPSDRPGQALNASTVGKGVFQHQLGFDLIGGENIPVAERITNGYRIDNSFRYGLSNKLEIGLGFTYQDEEIEFEDNVEFREQLKVISLRVRRGLFLSRNLKHQVAFEWDLNLPFYDLDFDEDLGSKFSLLSSHDLGYSFGLSANFSFILDPRYSIIYSYVINLGYGINDKWSVFIENYASLDPGSLDWGNSSDFKWDGGAAYLVNNDLQLDFFGGYDAVGSNQYEWFSSFGISWRIPKS